MSTASRSRPASPFPGSIRESRPAHVLWFGELGARDAARVGGKASALGVVFGALSRRGIRVPNGFATTADAYASYLDSAVPRSEWRALAPTLDRLDVSIQRRGTLRRALSSLLGAGGSTEALDLHDRCAAARALCLATPVPPSVRASLAVAYDILCGPSGSPIEVAVRSSATREDSADASFAGQYESFLAVRGLDAVLSAWRRCAASAFTERAVSYQMRHGMDPRKGAVSVVVMPMVRADLACSGVAFTLDPDSGNGNFVHVTSSYGLGEPVVQGVVSPDTFLVWKEGLRRGEPAIVSRALGSKEQKLVCAETGGATALVDVESSARAAWSLTDEEVLRLARMALVVEEHYGRPVDIEWAKDGVSGEILLVQARPETVHGDRASGEARPGRVVHSMDPALVHALKGNGRVLATGRAVGTRIASGRVRHYATYREVVERERELRLRLTAGEARESLPPEQLVFEPGEVLVTGMTTPDWEPLMRKASLIVTERGGPTSHAAIVARELGIPAIVGCGAGARRLSPLSIVTGSCAEGDLGYVFEGAQPFEIRRVDAAEARPLGTEIKLSIGVPERAPADAMLPSDGVGLARLEVVLTSRVGIHPLALALHDELQAFAESGRVPSALEAFEPRLRSEGPAAVRDVLAAMAERTSGYSAKKQFCIERLRDGVALICAAFHPRPVLLRLSDLKSNEYRALLGGRLFEPEEENPMIACRGAARLVNHRFAAAFEMECEALAQVRWHLGLDNLQVMVPFCRTPEEGRRVVELLARRRLSSADGVPNFLMVELPANVVEAESFMDEMRLAGGSIGTDDLVQTVYALSRDDLTTYGAEIDARSPAVRRLISEAIRRFNARGLEIGVCGEAPCDRPDEVTPHLVERGITSISATPATLFEVRAAVARAERGKPGLARLAIGA